MYVPYSKKFGPLSLKNKIKNFLGLINFLLGLIKKKKKKKIGPY
jgi:hypothetical protein